MPEICNCCQSNLFSQQQKVENCQKQRRGKQKIKTVQNRPKREKKHTKMKTTCLHSPTLARIPHKTVAGRVTSASTSKADSKVRGVEWSQRRGPGGFCALERVGSSPDAWGAQATRQPATVVRLFAPDRGPAQRHSGGSEAGKACLGGAIPGPCLSVLGFLAGLGSRLGSGVGLGMSSGRVVEGSSISRAL